MKPPLNRKCIFCDQPKKLTKEHLWSKWTRQLVSHDMLKHEYADQVFKVNGVDRSFRWMSSWDDAGKPVLSLLIKGDSAFLDASSQKLIATWIAMKTMVGEFYDPAKAAVPLRERQFLRDRRQPPDNWKIWIGNYTRDKWAGEWVHSAIGIDSAQGIARRRTKIPNTQTTTFVVGKLYAHIFSSEILDIIEGITLGKIGLEKLAQIWPIRESFVGWPTNALDDVDADMIAISIFLSLKNTLMASGGNPDESPPLAPACLDFSAVFVLVMSSAQFAFFQELGHPRSIAVRARPPKCPSSATARRPPSILRSEPNCSHAND
jgi:hypothetical protein